jgi:capsular polysaccharide biosynthesis protein
VADGGLMQRRYEPIGVAEMLAAPGWQERAHGVGLVVELPPVRVEIPALNFGRYFLERWPVRESPGFVDWRQAFYESVRPAAYRMDDVMLHSRAGIVVYEDRVVRETLAHTSPEDHHYVRDGESIVLDTPVRGLAGSYVSALAGANANYFHNVVDCVGRLSAVPEALLASADGILVPEGCAVVARMLELAGGMPPLVPVGAGETIRVQHVILPGEMYGPIDFHPCLMGVLDRVAAGVNRARGRGRRIYIDRRGAWRRKLLNEDAVIEALAPFGLELVLLEEMTIEAQIGLFRDAALIVAPHGAGLTNLVYAQPGCRVLELQMDAYVNWAFRRFAALRGVQYDCIIGRAVDPWTDLSPAVHGMRWAISVPHVVAAVHSMVG